MNTKKTFYLIFSFFIFLILLSCDSKKYNIFGSIKGEIRAESAGNIKIIPPPVVNGAYVSLSIDGKIIKSHTTKSGGNFTFDNLDPGQYTIIVEKKDFIVYNSESILVLSSETTDISIMLIRE